MQRKILWRVCRLLVVSAVVTAAVPAGTAFADHGRAVGRRHNRYHIYTLLPPLLDVSGAGAIAASFGLTPSGQGGTPGTVPPPGGGPVAFQDANGHVRGFFADGSVRIFPDLPYIETLPASSPLPNRRDALRMAMSLAQQWGATPSMGRLGFGELVTLTAEQMGPPAGAAGLTATAKGMGEGENGQGTDVLRTVRLAEELDGLKVFGPNSVFEVAFGAGGAAGGAVSLRLPGAVATDVGIITVGDAMKRFKAEFPYPVTGSGEDDQQNAGGGTTATAMAAPAGGLQGTLQSVRLIYYEQGGQYIQPAFLFHVLIVGPLGTVAGMNWLVPAVQDTPEPIINNPVGQGPSPLLAEPGTVLPLVGCEAPPDVKYGRYILRDDDPGWLVDTQGFGANIDAGNALLRFVIPATLPVNDYQYFWNYPWLWQPSGTPPTDQSPYFPGSVNMALIEGHGAPWLITTEKNCCDVIYLPDITGFGGYHTPAEITDYVIWQSCDVIPAPGDPYGGAYQSPASPFDVWFNMFQGMRGTYGYHTTMNIWNGVGKAFGFDAGLGAQNLAAWFTECDGNVFGHNGGWNYGSAVVVSGQEGDTLYDTCPLPPPGSLTIWWQHP